MSGALWRLRAGQLVGRCMRKPIIFYSQRKPLARSLQFRANASITKRWASTTAVHAEQTEEIEEPIALKRIDIAGKGFDPSWFESGWYEFWRDRGYFDSESTIYKTKDHSLQKKEPIRMLLPPPNVTGELHIGHALMLSIQDAYARYYRMMGYPVVWRPGTDHAGIATQTMVERHLGLKDRQALTREKLVKEIEKWTEKYGGTILKQMERIGASTDPKLKYYTLEKNLSEAVGRAFVGLYKDGLIYRDTRMVNWSIQAGTALSDMEVEFQDVGPGAKIEAAEFGILHTFAYTVKGMNGAEIRVSTTRPETTFGDTAIGVHPDDPKYKDFHYRYAIHPISKVKIPIVPDADLVDPDFGTGAVKITPAHDPKDFEFWRKHSSLVPKESRCEAVENGKRVPIKIVLAFNKNGEMLHHHPSIIGKDRLEARQRVINLLKDNGAYRKSSPHIMRIAKCSRTGCVIEPMLSPQWFLKTKPLAANVLSLSFGALGDEDKLVIRPHYYEEEWSNWLFRIKDWCLSRQIWWGHQIPAWKVVAPCDPYRSALQDFSPMDPMDPIRHINERWIIALTQEEAEKQLEDHEKNFKLVQDEDVLDTWFSSALLPLTTAGWTGEPNQKKAEWGANYPLTFIESGNDILFFWLARMALLCSWFTGKLPFNEILLHPLIYDSYGHKMSKSHGNVLDPLAIIEGRTLRQMKKIMEENSKAELRTLAENELNLSDSNVATGKAAKKAQASLKKKIKEFTQMYSSGITESGADSLRMTLIDYSRQQAINFSTNNVDNLRRLTIKLFNAYKYYHSMRARMERLRPEWKDSSSWKMWSLQHDWIETLQPHDLLTLFKLRKVIETCHDAFVSRRLHDALDTLRKFMTEDFANDYMMCLKIDLEVLVEPLKGQELPERPVVAMKLLDFFFENILRLFHPFMPYTTETLWQYLNPDLHSSIMVYHYPTAELIPPINNIEDIKRSMALVEQVTTKLQKLSNEAKKKKGQQKIQWGQQQVRLIVMGSPSDRNMVASYEKQIGKLAKMSNSLTILDDAAAKELLGEDVFGDETDLGIESWMKDKTGKEKAYNEGGFVEVHDIGNQPLVLFHPALLVDKTRAHGTPKQEEEQDVEDENEEYDSEFDCELDKMQSKETSKRVADKSNTLL